MASTLAETKKGRPKNLDDDLNKVFAPLRTVLPKALNVEDGEIWTFSIYSREKDGEGHVMRRLVALSGNPDEENDKRKWPMGQGFIGEAWRTGEELIVPDRDAPAYRARFHGTGLLRKSNDDALYKSVAIMPIIVGETVEGRAHENVIGCVSSTSNRANRFLADEADIHALNGALIRQIASITRLLVVSWQSNKSTEFIRG